MCGFQYMQFFFTYRRLMIYRHYSWILLKPIRNAINMEFHAAIALDWLSGRLRDSSCPLCDMPTLNLAAGLLQHQLQNLPLDCSLILFPFCVPIFCVQPQVSNTGETQQGQNSCSLWVIHLCWEGGGGGYWLSLNRASPQPCCGTTVW